MGLLDCVVQSIIILIHSLEPSHIIMSMWNKVNIQSSLKFIVILVAINAVLTAATAGVLCLYAAGRYFQRYARRTNNGYQPSYCKEGDVHH